MELNPVARLLRQFREQFGRELRSQAERLEAAEASVRELREGQQQLGASFEQQIDLLEKLTESAPSPGPPSAARSTTPPTEAIPTVVIPAKLVLRESGGAGIQSAHGWSDSGVLNLSDPQRFARLLVSEIELYHPEEVAEGRRRRDLYTRLRSAIERSREAYEKRYRRSAANERRHFDDELVKTLAAGDPALLGPDYPNRAP